ncbi:MAG: HAMP domain-containing histidine kinase [Fibrobacterota bacterium]|nr:HAMP domain-containing histidine kinase [Fibrobacterota bacterium]
MRELFLRGVHFLTRPNPVERRQNIWFQVEAKAERSANVIRAVYVLVWVMATAGHALGNPFWSNVANLGLGGFWLVWCIGYQWYLLRRPYRKWFKYLSTTVDMGVITAMIFTYQFTAGYAYALKVPTFLNYFCCLGLAAMRYRLHLAVYSGVTAALSYLFLCLYFYFTYDVEFGTGVEHATTAKISAGYIWFNFLYLVVFTLLTYYLVYNVKRLVNIRVREGEAALKAKERAAIAANVAHEIKNPLEGIYGAAQILKEEGKGSAKFIDMILKDSIRLNGVVHQFLQFSRPFRVSMSDFNLVQAISDFSREQASVAGDGKVRFHSDRESAMVHADQEGLRQVMLNLYQNARRYQEAGRAVDITVRANGEIAEVAVEDDGEGIPEENRERVFDPFFTTSSKGTGLGLAISRKIAREMGGDLYFEPKQPGARFVLSLKPGKPGETAA